MATYLAIGMMTAFMGMLGLIAWSVNAGDKRRAEQRAKVKHAA